MPAVFVDLLLEGQRKVELKGLLNSGATDLEVVVPRRVWKGLGVRAEKKGELAFGGRRFPTGLCKVKASVKNPETGEERSTELWCAVLPDRELDCVLLGTEAQAKLRVIPNTAEGKPLFL